MPSRTDMHKKPKASDDEPGLVISLHGGPRTVRLKAIIIVQIAHTMDKKKRPAVRITGIELDGFDKRATRQTAAKP